MITELISAYFKIMYRHPFQNMFFASCLISYGTLTLNEKLNETPLRVYPPRETNFNNLLRLIYYNQNQPKLDMSH